MQVSFEYFYTFLFVFVRMCGMIVFNPLFARRNVPSMVRMAIVLGLTIIISPTLGETNIETLGALGVAVTMMQELFVGFCCGFVFQIFNYLLFFVGDFLDMQFGLSMSKAFDPGTNIQASVTGKFLQMYFVLYLFATDAHIVLIRIFASSYMLLPIAAPISLVNASQFIFDLFAAIFVLVMRLSMPFFAAEFTLEITMGVLMKLIPQIHVFVINIQLKLIVGMLLLILFAVGMGSFMDNFINIMLLNTQRVIKELATIVG